MYRCGLCGQQVEDWDKHQPLRLSKPICTGCNIRIGRVDGIGIKNNKSTKNTRTRLDRAG